MGYSITVVCKMCGTFYTARHGGSLRFQILHCNKCGMEKTIFVTEVGEPFSHDPNQFEKIAGKCECGGKFKINAPPRCPKCSSSEYELSGKKNIIKFIRYE